MRTISGKARLAGVIGWPVTHSLSPALHGFWLGQYGIDGAYVPLNVAPAYLKEALALLPKLGFHGINVTVPHKEAAYALCDTKDIHARRIGAVNTILFDDTGRACGSNTDAAGFLENLREQYPALAGLSGRAAVVGAGGAARAVVCALADHGFTDIIVVNRTADRATDIAAAYEGKVRAVAWDAREAALEGAALLVNTTSLGMRGHPPLPLALDALPREALVADIVYTPRFTPLLSQAKTRGNPVADGLGMLLHQARPGFRAWFGREPEISESLRAHMQAAVEGKREDE